MLYFFVRLLIPFDFQRYTINKFLIENCRLKGHILPGESTLKILYKIDDEMNLQNGLKTYRFRNENM